MEKSDQQALVDTLGLAEVEVSASNKYKVLDFSEADKEQNDKIHENTNKLLLSLLDAGELGSCIHVTGAMRALADPFHRQICEAMRVRDQESFNVIYGLPKEFQNNAASVVGWNLEKWAHGKSRNWEDELRSIDVIANRSVDLFAFDTSSEIQYSVFGNRHILLQEKHSALAASKRIWLLESENINGTLVERGFSMMNGAMNIDEGMFHEFALSLSGVAAGHYLKKLQYGPIERDSLLNDSFIVDFVRSPQDSFDSLLVMGFVHADAQSNISITQTGREFLGAY